MKIRSNKKDRELLEALCYAKVCIESLVSTKNMFESKGVYAMPLDAQTVYDIENCEESINKLYKAWY